MMYDLLVERMLNGLAKNKTINDLAKKHKVSVAIVSYTHLTLPTILRV